MDLKEEDVFCCSDLALLRFEARTGSRTSGPRGSPFLNSVLVRFNNVVLSLGTSSGVCRGLLVLVYL